MRGDDGLIGVDIGLRSVKVAQVIRRGDAVVEVRRSFARITSDLPWEPGGDSLAVERALTAALDQAGVKGRRAVCVIPRHQVTLRFTELPGVRPEELARIAALEAEQHIPLPPAETVIGCEVLAKPARDGDLAPVLIVAARRAVVEAYLAVLHSVGLQVERVTTDALSHFRLWQAEGGDASPAFLLDIGARGMVISLVEGGLLRMSRAVPGGGEELTRAFEADFSLPPGEAELQKQAKGLQALADGGAQRVRQWLDSLTAEVRRSALAVAAQSVQPSRIFLSGGGALVSGLASALEESTRMRTGFLAPRSDLVPAAEAAVFTLAYAAGVTVGAKAGGLNLELPEVKARERSQQRRRTSTAVGVAVGMALITFIGGSLWQLRSRQAELAAIDHEWRSSLRTSAKAQALRSDQQQMSGQVGFLTASYRSRRSALDALLQLHEVAPSGVWLTNLAMERTTASPTNPTYRLQLTGKAPSNSVVADLVAALQKTEGIDRVTFENVKGTEFEKQPVVEFSVTCRFTERAGAPRSPDSSVETEQAKEMP